MASGLMRRSGWTAALATMAAAVTPLITQASAATFSGTVTSSPARDSNGAVHANRPTLVGTFSDNLKSGSTITVWDKADSAKTDVCGGSVINGKTVSCTAPADLSTTKTYDAVAHGVRASDGATADSPVFEFTVDYPVLDPANTYPKPQESIVNGGETITAAFNENVTGDTATAFRVYELNPDGTRGVGPLGGTTKFPGTALPPGPGKTVTFTPSTPLVDGEYEAVVTVNGVNSDGSKNAAAVGTADYRFFIDGASPQNLSSPAIANNANDTAFPFSGTAAPGLTVTVDVQSNDPTATISPTGGSAVVPVCEAAPNCPWTVPVDVSGLSDGTYKWTAQSSDADNSKSPVATAPNSFKLDTTAPGKPTSGSATIEPSGQVVDVSAGRPSDGDFVGFTVTITDPESHTAVQQFDTTGDLTNGHVDVSGLDNGTLTVSIQSRDNAGNLSNAYTSGFPASQPTVTKNVPFAPNFGTSTFTSGGQDVPFTTAETTPVQPPSKITVEFNEATTLSYTSAPDPSHPTGQTHNSAACITYPSGNCTSYTIGPFQETSDGHGFSFTVPKLPDGGYGLRVTAYSAGCGSPGGTCDTYSQVVTLPATTTPFHYTVDGTAPKVTITSLTNPITPTKLQTAAIAGTADSDVSVVKLTLKSSNDPTPRVATAPVSSGQWSLHPLPLSGIVDGTLTITVTGADAAGNTGTAIGKTALSGLALRAVPGDGTVALTWQRPTLAGNAAPRYTLTVADRTTGTAAQPITPPPSTSATSFRVANLVDGHAYTFTLKATDANGNGPVAVRTVTPRGTTRVTEYATAHTVTYGQSVTLHGRLTDAGGHGVGGMRLSLYPVYSNGHKGGAAHPSTNSTGYWSFATKPVANATYVISFGGDAARAGSSAKTGETVKVAIRITSVSSRSSSHTVSVRIAGTVGPNEAGRHVYIYEIVGGRNVRIAAVTLSRTSTFAYTHTWSRGTHTVFARFYSQNGITGNNSRTVQFTRS